MTLDTHGGKKRLPIVLFSLLKALKRCKNMIILPAQNGLRVIAPFLLLGNVFFQRTLHYIVIGGWLPQFLEKKLYLTAVLKKFDYIYVETSAMKKALVEQGFNNIEVLPNCKDLKIVDEADLVYAKSEPYRLCTFSRVMKEKGIEDAVYAVRSVNEFFGRTVYTLDIFGQVDSNQTKWFETLKETFPNYISYGGIVPFDESTKVLKDYYLLLFPTRFYTEGIPGTIIDAYAAGVPVVSSKWEGFSDVIVDQITGVGYDHSDAMSLKNVLLQIAEKPRRINSMKLECIKRASNFTPEIAMDGLIHRVLIKE